MYDHAVAEGVFQLSTPGTRWLSTGWDGGYRLADVAYNVSVPSAWEPAHLERYGRARRERAGFERAGPTLFTGVDLVHARGARMGPIVAIATAGISNPAVLPMEPRDEAVGIAPRSAGTPATGTPAGADTFGTVNILVGSTQPLTDGALATLLATVVEAKTATLRSLHGFTGTTTDAVVVGTPARADDGGVDRQPWAGSGTALGNAARVCVRDAVRASIESRHGDEPVPENVDEAEYGVVAGGKPAVFVP